MDLTELRAHLIGCWTLRVESVLSLSCMMMFVLWDVLSVTAHTLLHLYIGPEHAWLLLAVLCGVCALDRDLEMHEIVAAIYMLRFACQTVEANGIGAYLSCILVLCVSCWAHTEAFLTLHHMYRRGATYAVIILAVMIRYPWNFDPYVSIGRLVVYTVITRRYVTYLSQDTWDSSAQSIWIFSAPLYVLYAGILWPFLVAAYNWHAQSAPGKHKVRTVWSSTGIEMDVV